MSIDSRDELKRSAALQGQLTKYNSYSKNIKRLLMICGLWPDLHPMLQRLVGSVAFATVLFTFAGAINFSLHHISDIMVFTQTFGLPLTMPGIMMKICIFLSYREDLLKLSRDLSVRFVKDLQNVVYQPLALFHCRSLANLSYALTTTVGVTSSLTSVVIPLLALRHGKYVPVIPSMFPFAYEAGSLVYWLVQLGNACGAFFIWSVTCGVDSILGLYTLQICGELRILAHKFENLETCADYRDNLKECMQRHRMLMSSRDTLERVFGFLVLWLAVTSAIVQCTLVFQMSELLKTMNISKIVYIAAFISLKLVQAYMYAWYGNLISHESSLCLDAIYNSRWAGSGDTKFMSDVLIVVSQRPLGLTAIGCLKVKMEMFAKIVQTSVSYFCLLQTLSKE